MAVNYVTTQTCPEYQDKVDIWKQISNSYDGGITYRNGSYLHKFTLRESKTSYEERQKRAIYFNNVKPLADLLMGFLFTNEILRDNIKQEEIIEKATKTETLDNFMQQVALNSLLYTTGILVDSPKFDASEVQTEADRKAMSLNPYCVLYHPWQVRNYYCDDTGSIAWVLLDNSYYDNSNPYAQAKTIKQYRLWTREYFQDFTSDGTFKEGGWIEGEQVPHNLGEVPFIFVNWIQRTNLKFQSTIFEDIALFDQAIYNYMSLADEMLAGGTFKFLFYPGTTPDEIKSQGFSNLAIIPFSDQAVHEPKFDGPSLSEVDPFLKYIDFLLVGILRKLGLNTDMEKNYVQSGAAKVFDFSKTRALLSAGCESMEMTEAEIFRFSGLWMGIDDSNTTIEYQKDFLGAEAEAELAHMYNLITLPFQKIREFASKRIASLLFANTLNDEELDEIYEDIEGEIDQAAATREAGRVNIQNLAEQQKGESNGTNNTGQSGQEDGQPA